MQKVFISYARTDEQRVRDIATALQDVNITIWMDVFDIKAGDNWRDSIQVGLGECNVMILAVTHDSMQSKQVSMEWQYFLDEGKRVIPIILSATPMHFQLSPLQHIDFQNHSFADAIDLLLKALNEQNAPQLNPDDARALDILRTAYRNWLSFDRDSSLLLDSRQITIIVDSFSAYNQLSQNLWRFLLTSIASNEIDIRSNNQIVDSLNNLNSADQLMIFSSQLAHPLPKIRQQTVYLIRQLKSEYLVKTLQNAFREEKNSDVVVSMILTLAELDGTIDQYHIREEFNDNNDWMVKSQLLPHLETDKKAVLFVTDGSELAEDFREMLEEAEFTVVDVMPQDIFAMPIVLPGLPDDILMSYDLIVLMRGEHYSSTSNDAFYEKLTHYVVNGGLLFATSWTGWESKENQRLAKILPFAYRDYHENVVLTCVPTDAGLSEKIFTDAFTVMTSYESLVPHEDTIVMLASTSQIPVFGYRYIGEGRTFYLNSCQHSCTKSFEAQTRASKEFRLSFYRFFEWIHTQV